MEFVYMITKTHRNCAQEHGCWLSESIENSETTWAA